ncbi:hypothetical protein [Methanolapillus millepedarum]|uniref:Uncharacterized protein n=1 Tax=Methanolapillus millepedarum TaxID=3028296 RepID=A0AA96V3E5_9EURY|nr:hypothetical protein MsAc7_14180 [Methanosarcinaceae archaeon Ac7]
MNTLKRFHEKKILRDYLILQIIFLIAFLLFYSSLSFLKIYVSIQLLFTFYYYGYFHYYRVHSKTRNLSNSWFAAFFQLSGFLVNLIILPMVLAGVIAFFISVLDPARTWIEILEFPVIFYFSVWFCDTVIFFLFNYLSKKATQMPTNKKYPSAEGFL